RNRRPPRAGPARARAGRRLARRGVRARRRAVPRAVRPPRRADRADAAVLGVVAKHGDGWHPTHVAPDRYAERLAQLEPLLAAEGRSLDDVALTARLDRSWPLDE